MPTYPVKPWSNGQQFQIVPGETFQYDLANTAWTHVTKATLDSDYQIEKNQIVTDITSNSNSITTVVNRLDADSDTLSTVINQITVLEAGSDSDIIRIDTDLSTINARIDVDSDTLAITNVNLNNLQSDFDSDIIRIDTDLSTVNARIDFDSDRIQTAIDRLDLLDLITDSETQRIENNIDRLNLVFSLLDSDALDLAQLRLDYDSEILNLKNSLTSRLDSDETVLQYLQTQIKNLDSSHDSDVIVINHDFAAADSDLQVQIDGLSLGPSTTDLETRLDSEILARKSADSDLQVQITAAAASGGGITYTRKTANYTAEADEGIIADTSGGTWTLSLPSSPSSGDVVVVADGNDWSANSLTIGRNGSTIEGDAADMTMDIGGVSVTFIYDGSTWQTYAQVGVAGDVVTPTGTQTLTNKTLTSPVFNTSVSFGDNVVANFGDSNDLQILHNATNSVIRDVGTGVLSLQSNGVEVSLFDTANSQYLAQFQVAGANILYHNGTQKFTTTTAGVTVKGDATFEGAIDETVYGLSGTSVALNPSNGTIQMHGLTGNTTYTDSFSAGESITLMIDDGSAHAITWPSVTWVNNGGSAPTLATSGYTVVILWKAGSTLYGALIGDGS